MLLRLLDVLTVFLVITQVVLPLIEGVPLLPLFRGRKTQQLLREIEEATRTLEEDRLREELTMLAQKHAEEASKKHESCSSELTLKQDGWKECPGCGLKIPPAKEEEGQGTWRKRRRIG